MGSHTNRAVFGNSSGFVTGPFNLTLISAPVATGTISIGSVLSTTTGVWVSANAFTYQWKRDGTSIGGATNSTYTVTSSDPGYSITCVVTANGIFAATSNSLTYSLAQIGNLKYGYDNVAAQSTNFTSILDKSANARTLTTSVTATAQPQAFPRNWAHNGKPVIGFNHVNSQYATDLAADSGSYGAILNQPGTCAVWKGSVGQAAGLTQLIGTWDLGTSNQNAFSFAFDATNQRIEVYKTSTNAGGTVHLTTVTANGAVKAGDVVQITLRHNGDRTWASKIVREARVPGDTQLVVTASGTSSANANTGSAVHGLTLGARGNLAAFSSNRLFSTAIFTSGSTTVQDIADWEAYCANSCNFSFLTFDNDAPMTPATHFSDGLHWNDSGHSIVGLSGRILEQACVTSMSLSGTVKVGVIGDSRMMGTSATVLGVTDARAIIQQGSGSFTFTRQAVGPINDGGGTSSSLHFARSGYVTRTNSSQTGHSQRTPGATTIDVYVTGSFGDTRIWHWQLGNNDANSNNYWQFDSVDERCRIFEYLISTQQALSGITPGFVIQNEPASGVTTTGTLQYLLRNLNREHHSMVAYLQTLTTVKMGNLNLTSLYP